MSERGLAVRNEIDIESLGAIFVASGFFADTRSKAQAIVKIIAGDEMGFGPMASMRGVHIIEGKPTIAADLIAAAIQRSKRYAYRVAQLDNNGCTINFYEAVDGKLEKLGASTFDQADAKAAGLLGRKGDMYSKFPRNMYFSRALSNGARWYCPEIFSGAIYTPDELGATVDGQGQMIDIQLEPEEAPPTVVPTDIREVDDADLVRSADDRLWQRWMALVADANRWRVKVPNVKLGVPRQELIQYGVELKQLIDERQALLAEQDAERAAAQQAPGAPTAGQPAGAEAAPQDTPWERNQVLHLQTYRKGLKLRELPVSATPEEIEAQNRLMEDWLASGPQAT